MYFLSGHGLVLEDIVHFYSYRSGSLLHRKEAEQSVSGTLWQQHKGAFRVVEMHSLIQMGG